MLINVRLMVFFYETEYIASLYGQDYYVCIGTIFAFYGNVDYLKQIFTA